MSFFYMGGYAAYVWPSFGGAAIILLALLYISWRSLKLRITGLESLENLKPKVDSSGDVIKENE